MNTTLYIDNLALTLTESDLRQLFLPYGKVGNVDIPLNKAGGASRGFGFVTMCTLEGARSAMRALHGKSTAAGPLTVSEAWPCEPRPPSPTPNPPGPGDPKPTAPRP